MPLRLTVCLATALVLGAAAASAQPMSDQQRDRAIMHQDVGAMHENSAELGDLDAQIQRLAFRIRHEHGYRQRADVARAHELQARAQEIRAQTRQLGRDNHAVLHDYQHDYQQDRGAPH